MIQKDLRHRRHSRRVVRRAIARIKHTLWVYWLLLVVLSLTAGCRDDHTTKPGRCADQPCNFGICNAALDVCENPASCTHSDQCLEGYECTGDGICTAQIPCDKSAVCTRGECRQGACVNAPHCTNDLDCRNDYYCSLTQSTCVRDQCSDKACTRGQCHRASGECINAAQCSASTEQLDCVDGYLCYQDQCVSRASICAQLDCENQRGVCNTDTLRCTNSENCMGDDFLCIDGFFCDENNVCSPNHCDNDDHQCARGQCEPTTGECVNATACTSSQQCLDGFQCVGGFCEARDVTCSACPGNQECDYNEDTLSATCKEHPSGCFDGYDCLGDRICDTGSCREPFICTPDDYEPNNTALSSTRLNHNTASRIIEASICPSDIDFYSFDTADFPLDHGTIIIELRYFQNDRGNGDLNLIIRNSENEIVAQQRSNRHGVIAIDIALHTMNQGVYSIEVSSATPLNMSGIRYTLYADVATPEMRNKCQQVDTISEGFTQPTYNTDALFTTTCSPGIIDDSYAYQIYTFELEHRSHISLSAKTSANDNRRVYLSVRQNCSAIMSELVCASYNTALNRPNAIETTLNAGQYFVIIQELDPTSIHGDYVIEFNAEPVVCRAPGGYCLDSHAAAVCNSAGTEYAHISCHNGCNQNTGLCNHTPGDTCYAAVEVNERYQGAIRWTQHENIYDHTNACAGESSINPEFFGGPDKVYRVGVPAGHYLQADLMMPADSGILYLLKDCVRATQRCLGWSQPAHYLDIDKSLLLNHKSHQHLIWQNPSTQQQYVYLVADSTARSIAGDGFISIITGPKICEPGHQRCSTDGIQTCNEAGNEYKTTVPCPYGCEAESTQCYEPQNQLCKGAIDIIHSDNTFSGSIGDYDNSYDPGANGCTSSSLPGNDATFFVDAQQGQILRANIKAQFDVALWLVSDCTTASASCLDSSYSSSSNYEAIEFEIPTDGRYYLIVDSSNQLQTGKFLLHAELSSPSCHPGDYLGCESSIALRYCSNSGINATHHCDTSCIDGQCDIPNGDICQDAIPVQHGQTVQGRFGGYNSHQKIESGDSTCLSGSHETPGSDTFYAIELREGESLRIDGTSDEHDAIFYLLEDCFSNNTCLDISYASSPVSLQYLSPRDQIVYFVASRTKPGAGLRQSYSFNVQITSPQCDQSDSQCVDASTLEYCLSWGTRERYSCPNGCEDGQCIMPSGDVCQEAIKASQLDTFTGNFSGSNSITPAAHENEFCNFEGIAPDGNDTIYEVAIGEGQRLSIEVDSTSPSALVYLLTDCSRSQSCLVNSSPGRKHSLQYISPIDQILYVVVDSISDTPSTHLFDINIAVQSPQGCSAGHTVCLNEQFLAVCADSAYYDVYRCDGGCQSGQCQSPRGDICEDAITLSSGSIVTDSFLGPNSMDIEPGIYGQQCDFRTDTPVGPRKTYRIDLYPGQVLHAMMESASDNAMLYLLAECDQPQSCVSATNAQRQNTLLYTATTHETLYLVVSTTQASHTPINYTLRTFVQSPGCEPGTITCMDDAQSLGICDDDGIFTPYLCDGGCINDQCVNKQGDICHDAITLSPDASYVGSWGMIDSINPGTKNVHNCHFGSHSALGREKIFQIPLPAYRTLKASLTTDLPYASMYLLESCTDSQSCLANDYGTGNSHLYHRNSTGAIQYVYLVVDAIIANDISETFSLAIEYLEEECSPGDTVCINDSELGICNTERVYHRHRCSSQLCADNECTPNQGDSCHEAIKLSSNQTVSGTWTGTDQLNPGTGISGYCDFGNLAAVGADTIYTISLLEDQLLELTLDTSQNSALLYLLEDCNSLDSCLLNTGSVSISEPAKLFYSAPSDQTVYVVVDRQFSPRANVTYNLHAVVHTPECEPNSRQCSSDSQALEVCNEYGVWQSFPCLSGCSNDQCNTPSGDVCYDAIPLNHGDIVSGTWEGTNAINPGGGTLGSCAFNYRQPRGSDTIYSIHLNDDEVLTATLNTAYPHAMLYLVENCTDDVSCLEYDAGVPHSPLRYKSTGNQMVYLIVDSSALTPTSADYTIDIDIRLPECVPGTTQCSDNQTMQYCNPHGIYESHDCLTECLSGYCSHPAGDICADALPLDANERFHGSLANYTNAHNPGLNSCLNSAYNSQPGPDAVFVLSLAAGDIITIDLGTDDNTLGMYIMDSCATDPGESCLLAQPRSVAMTFFAPETKDYYLVVDSTNPTSTAEFSLIMNHTMQGGICQPGESTCATDTNILSICNDDGTDIITQQICKFGCHDDRCAGPPLPNDSCTDAYPVEESIRIVDEFSRFTNAVNVADVSCASQSLNGRDALYQIDIPANYVLTARAMASHYYERPSLYLLDRCATETQYCIDVGHNERNQSSLTYFTDVAQQVYLVVDSYGYAQESLFLDIDLKPAQCNPGERFCVDNVAAECTDDRVFEEQYCVFGCDDDRCLPGTNNRCENAIDANFGLEFSADYSLYTNHYDLVDSSVECNSRSTSGSDAIFFVDAQKNDIIHANLSSYGDIDPVLWISNDCSNLVDSCLATSTAHNSNDNAIGEHLSWVVPQAGRYFVVADSYLTTEQLQYDEIPGGFTLDVDVEPPFCTAMDSVCVDENTLSYCAPDGTEFIGLSCQGGCSDGQCGAPGGNLCADAIDASSGGVFSGSFDALSDNFDPTFGGCTYHEAPGPDVIYSLHLTSGQTVTATVSNINANNDLSLYLVDDCRDVANSCRAGSDAYGASAETISYTAVHDGIIYIIADTWNENASGDYLLEIVIQ